MSEYYAVIRDGQDDHLEHLFGFGSRKGSQKANHKYIARVQVGNGWKYFYNTAELAAYKAGGAVKKAGNAVGKAAGGAYEKAQLAGSAYLRGRKENAQDAGARYRASKNVYRDLHRAGQLNSNNFRDVAVRDMNKNYRKAQAANQEYKRERAKAGPIAAVRKAAKAADNAIGVSARRYAKSTRDVADAAALNVVRTAYKNPKNNAKATARADRTKNIATNAKAKYDSTLLGRAENAARSAGGAANKVLDRAKKIKISNPIKITTGEEARKANEKRRKEREKMFSGSDYKSTTKKIGPLTIRVARKKRR